MKRAIPSQTELDAMLKAQMEFLRRLSIPISDQILPRLWLNSRAKARLGCCIRKGDHFIIELSACCFEHAGLPEQTLLHELLHTCPNCNNHGALWKRYAAIVSAAAGYTIRRTVERTEQEMPTSFPYRLRCEACGKEIRRQRLTKVITNPERYRCTCAGKLVRLPDVPKVTQ